MGPFGVQELVVILLILVVLFGASRVAGIGGALGKGIRDFRSEVNAPEKPEDKPAAVAEKPAEPADKTG